MLDFSLDSIQMAYVNKLLDSISPKSRHGIMRKSLVKAGLEVERRLIQNLSGPILHRRTGHLAQSVGSSIVEDATGNMTCLIGSGVRGKRERVVYANILETGGVIRPVRGKYLAIPLDGAKTRAGVARGGPRDYDNTFIATSKKGNPIIFQKSGNRGNIVPLFVLVKSVTIPAFQYMSRTLEQTRNVVVNTITNTIKQALAGKANV